MDVSQMTWRSIGALGMWIALANAPACGGKKVPPDTTGDASAQGGSGGSSGHTGSGGDAGHSGDAGQGGNSDDAGLGGNGGNAGHSGDAGQGGTGHAGQGGQGGAGQGGAAGRAGFSGWGGGDPGGTGGTADANCVPARDAGGPEDLDAAPPGTFRCWGSQFCLVGAEYCAVASFNGSTVAGPTCRPFPNGCSTCACMQADARSCVFARVSQGCRGAIPGNVQCFDSTTSPPYAGPTVICAQP
ncbi:MAG TPA: hypothetical protein VK540_04240 [Polyangiaceae bacterium]|nr:hypothetical protein [Polyangiaceae bacterium]